MVEETNSQDYFRTNLLSSCFLGLEVCCSHNLLQSVSRCLIGTNILPTVELILTELRLFPKSVCAMTLAQPLDYHRRLDLCNPCSTPPWHRFLGTHAPMGGVIKEVAGPLAGEEAPPR